MYQTSDRWMQALRKSHSLWHRLSVVDRDGDILFELPNVTDGRLSGSMDGAVRRSLDCTVANPDPSLVPRDVDEVLGDNATELTLRSGIMYEDRTLETVPCGIYVISESNITRTQHGVTIELRCDDRSVDVSGNSVAPIAVAPGTSVNDAIKKLVLARRKDIDFNLGVDDATVGSLFYQGQTDLWSEAVKLANGGGQDLAFDVIGECTKRDFDAEDAEPVMTFGPRGNMPFFNLKRTMTKQNIYNGVIVIGNNSSSNGQIHGEAWDERPNSPLRKDGPFGRRPKFVNSEIVHSSDGATKYAHLLLTRLMKGFDGVSLDIPTNAALDFGDHFTVEDELSGAHGSYMLDSLSFTMTPGLMSITGRRSL